MLTTEQKTLMTEILDSNTKLSSDQTAITGINGLVNNPNVSTFIVENYTYGDYSQRVYAVITGASPFEWWIYTSGLITDRTSQAMAESQSLLDENIQTNITEPLATLKTII